MVTGLSLAKIYVSKVTSDSLAKVYVSIVTGVSPAKEISVYKGWLRPRYNHAIMQSLR